MTGTGITSDPSSEICIPLVFNSLSYLFFLSLSALAYYCFPARFRWGWLLLVSAAYYLSFIPVFFFLIAGLVTANYLAGLWIGRAVRQGALRYQLVMVVVLNILVLAFFKYFNFFFPGLKVHLFSVDWFYRSNIVSRMMIPLGLSYLLFTVIGYQIEVKRNNIQPERHFGYFSLYLLFFPRIAQGPIERPGKLLSQLRDIHHFDYDLVANGMKLILWGYFKKLVVADRLAVYVNAVYSNSAHHNGTTLIVATIFFGFQIYADFSAYTDIAIGSARIFGIRLTDNFRQPYLATSVKEFWNRWHITFSTWLRDYLFLPIAFYLSKTLKKEQYLNVPSEKWIYLFSIMITFAICGLWHGEGMTYLTWGLLFGTYLTFANWSEKSQRNFRKRFKIKKTSTPYIVMHILLTFVLVSFAWIFFRAGTLSDASGIIRKIFTSAGTPFYESPANLIYAIAGISALIAVDLKREYYQNTISLLHSKYSLVRIGTIASLVIATVLMGVLDGGQFIYFKF